MSIHVIYYEGGAKKMRPILTEEQKSLRGDCGGDGVPSAVGNSSPRAKKFPEEICFAPSRVCQICRTPD